MLLSMYICILAIRYFLLWTGTETLFYKNEIHISMSGCDSLPPPPLLSPVTQWFSCLLCFCRQYLPPADSKLHTWANTPPLPLSHPSPFTGLVHVLFLLL